MHLLNGHSGDAIFQAGDGSGREVANRISRALAENATEIVAPALQALRIDGTGKVLRIESRGGERADFAV